jgi:Helix-turn-helix domain
VADDAGAARYRLLETVGDYAAAKLEARSAMVARAVRKAHRNHYLALAEAAAPELIGPGQVEWLNRLTLELDNLRAALSTCLLDPDPNVGLRLSTAMHNFWLYREPTTEGAASVCAALDRPEARQRTLIRGSALVAAASLLTTIDGEHDAAIARAREALAIAQALRDEELRARAIWALALIALNRGEADRVLAAHSHSDRPDFDEVLRALADPSRRRLLDSLNARNGHTLRELCADMEMARQSVSKHLGVLEAANLVTTLWRGREKLH